MPDPSFSPNFDDDDTRSHWSKRFPELHRAAEEPLLDILRLALFEEADHPVARVLAVAGQALGRPLDLTLPGDIQRSFDERWLLALFEALRNTDLTRYQFLLRSRLPVGGAARLHFALTQAQVWIEARL
jgi:hypothetical protein